MADITKILFRQGTNIIRRLQSIIFDLGEPAFTVDTKRLYVGDGSTVGGIPAGVKNWGTYTPVFSSLSPRKYSSTVATIISAIEAGDIIYDAQNLALFYATSAYPTESQWNQYSFSGLTLSGFNGVNISTLNGVVSAQLDPTRFTVDSPNQNFTVNYNFYTTTGKNAYFGNNVTSTGMVSTNNGDGNSNNWGRTYTAVASNSANWNSGYTTVNSNSAGWTSSTPKYAFSQLFGVNDVSVRLSAFNSKNDKTSGTSARVIGYPYSFQGDFSYTSIAGNVTTLYSAAVSCIVPVSLSANIYINRSGRVYVDNYMLSSWGTSGLIGSGISTLNVYVSTPGVHTISLVTNTDGSPPITLAIDRLWNTSSMKYVSAGFVNEII